MFQLEMRGAGRGRWVGREERIVQPRPAVGAVSVLSRLDPGERPIYPRQLRPNQFRIAQPGVNDMSAARFGNVGRGRQVNRRAVGVQLGREIAHGARC